MLKKFRIDLLLRIIRRVDSFTDICDSCRSTKDELTQIVDDLDNTASFGTREQAKAMQTRIDAIIKHLQETHKLVKPGHYIGLFSSFGFGIGIAGGVLLGNSAIGTAVGAGLALLIGFILDQKAKRDGRTI